MSFLFPGTERRIVELKAMKSLWCELDKVEKHSRGFRDSKVHGHDFNGLEYVQNAVLSDRTIRKSCLPILNVLHTTRSFYVMEFHLIFFMVEHTANCERRRIDRVLFVVLISCYHIYSHTYLLLILLLHLQTIKLIVIIIG